MLFILLTILHTSVGTATATPQESKSMTTTKQLLEELQASISRVQALLEEARGNYDTR